MHILPQARINCHGHLLPEPHQVPKFMRDKELFWVSDDKKYMCQGKWRRPVTDPSFFLSQKIDWMDASDIDITVLLNLSQLYCNGMDAATTVDVIRWQNDFNASVATSHPDRFISGFVVQPRYLDQAIAEIDRCVHDLKMPVVCLPTHYMDDNEKWSSVADPRLIPLWQYIDDLGLAVQIHPYNAEEMIALEDRYWRFHLIWMCAQTADTILMYQMLDFDFRFSKSRVCFAHGGQAMQMGFGRVKQGYEGRSDLFEGARHPSDHLALSHVFYDTLVHDLDSFELLLRRQSPAQIVVGIDDPYPLGEMQSPSGSYPGRLLDLAETQCLVSTVQKNEIWHSNALRWIYGK
jgi:aminocarboxymuconate-semialdehyde decarboxylase